MARLDRGTALFTNVVEGEFSEVRMAPVLCPCIPNALHLATRHRGWRRDCQTFGNVRRVMESTTYPEPTIIARRDDEDKEGVAYVGGQNALIVFRSKDEAEKFRDYSGLYPASEGFEAIPVDEEEIGRTCVRHDLRRICVPEPWTGTSGASFYDAAKFSGMLRESVLDEDG